MQSSVEHATAKSDRELVELACRGDRSGFEQLVARYQNRLFRSVFARVGCASIAEEVVQDAFIRAFQHIHTFQQRSQFYSWLFRIALNSTQDHYRKNRVFVSIDSNPAISYLLETANADSPSCQAERMEDRDQVRNALKRLPTQVRKILVLRELEGLNYEEIADVMHLNLGTVRSRLSRARGQLRDELRGYFDSSASLGLRKASRQNRCLGGL